MKDPMPNAKAPVIVSKVERHKNIVLLDVSEIYCFLFMHACTSKCDRLMGLEYTYIAEYALACLYA